MCELQGLAWLVRKTIDIASVVVRYLSGKRTTGLFNPWNTEKSL